MTPVFVINGMGTVRFLGLNKTARMSWEWYQGSNLYILASYINIKDNIYPDIAFRTTDSETK